MENIVFINRIREARAEKRFTQAEIAKEIGVSVTTYAGYEQGYREPNLDILNKLADFFECSIDYLTGRSDDFGVISIKNPSNFNFSPKTKEMLSIFEYLPKEYQAQVLEYARYIAERLSKSNTRQR